MSLLVLGTVALDDIRTPAGTRRELLGGSAAHFAMSARLFTDVHLVAVIGEDFPKRYVRFLRNRGLDLSSLTREKGKSFRWKGQYREGDLNTALTLATELGVLAGFTPRVAGHQKRMAHVFLANSDPDVQIALLDVLRRPRFVGLDSMNLWIGLKDKRRSLMKLMKRVDLFVANDGEARALTGESNLFRAARRLQRMGPAWVVIKKGEHGAVCSGDEATFGFPAYPVRTVVDPTGAGDTFAGGLMGYLASVRRIGRKEMKTAVLYATTAASFNVEGFGMSRTAFLTRARVNKRMKALVRFMSP